MAQAKTVEEIATSLLRPALTSPDVGEQEEIVDDTSEEEVGEEVTDDEEVTEEPPIVLTAYVIRQLIAQFADFFNAIFLHVHDPFQKACRDFPRNKAGLVLQRVAAARIAQFGTRIAPGDP